MVTINSTPLERSQAMAERQAQLLRGCPQVHFAKDFIESLDAQKKEIALLNNMGWTRKHISEAMKLEARIIAYILQRINSMYNQYLRQEVTC